MAITLKYDPEDPSCHESMARQIGNHHVHNLFRQADKKKFGRKMIFDLCNSCHLGGQQMAIDAILEVHAANPFANLDEFIGHAQISATYINNAFRKKYGYQISDKYTVERVMREQGQRV